MDEPNSQSLLPPERRRFLSWAAVLVASLLVIGLGMRVIALHGVSASSSLLVRGLMSSLIVAVLAKLGRRESLKPRALRAQVFRGALAGAALFCFTASYGWLTASAVSVLANVDVPLLIVLGPSILGTAAGPGAGRRTRAFAGAAIGLLVAYVCAIERATGARALLCGLSALGVGTVLLCVCYALIRRSMDEENESVTTFVPALAMAAFGAVGCALSESVAAGWDGQAILAAVAAAVAMVVCYYSTFRLYELADLATAEFPTLIGAIVIQPIEHAWLGAPLETSYLVTSIAFVLVVGLIVRRQRHESRESIPAAAHG